MATQSYKFRADCIHDVALFRKVMNTSGCSILKFKIDTFMGEPEVEMECDLSLDDLVYLLSLIINGHVMMDSIQLSENYTGAREYRPTPEPSEKLSHLKDRFSELLEREEVVELTKNIPSDTPDSIYQELMEKNKNHDTFNSIILRSIPLKRVNRNRNVAYLNFIFNIKENCFDTSITFFDRTVPTIKYEFDGTKDSFDKVITEACKKYALMI